MHRLKLISLILILFGFFSYNTVSSANDEYFVYLERLKDESVIHIVTIDALDENSISVPQIKNFALSNTTPLLAFTDTDDFVYIINLETKQVKNLDVRLNDNLDVLHDAISIVSRSLHWSPDGSQLAFIGNENHETNLYRYSVAEDELVELTENAMFTDTRVDISSWSPDGNWLALVGLWVSKSSAPVVVNTAIISKDGSTWIEAENAIRSCRLSWSIDMDYLVTSSDCYVPFTQTTEIILLGFDLERQALSNLPSTIEQEQFENHFVYRSMPIWVNENTLSYIRYRAPVAKRYGETIETDIIRASISDNDFQIVETRSDHTWHVIENNWYLSHAVRQNQPQVFGYNPVNNMYLPEISIDDPCVISSVKFSSTSDLLAFTDRCSLAGIPSTVSIYAIESGEALYQNSLSGEIALAGFTSN